ncbi:MAG: hypothetical protein QM607_04815 [Microbacterium sp.]
MEEGKPVATEPVPLRPVGKLVKRTTADGMRKASSAWQLRVAGRSWEDIAREVGFSDAPHAHRAVRNFFGSVPQPAREELRELARARGEVVFRQALEDVLDQRPGAVRAAVAVLQRQAALDGLDEPTRAHVRVSQEHLDELLLEALEATGATPVEVDIWADEP